MKDHGEYDKQFFAKFGYHLNRTSHILAALFEDGLEKYGITLPMWRLIWCIDTFGAISLSELASHSGFEMSWLTRIVATAQNKNLVIRTKDKKKKSMVRVYLTPEGHALIRDVLPIIQSIGRESLIGIPDTEVEITTRTLNAIYKNVINIVETSGSMNKKLLIARRAINRAKPQSL